MCIELISEMEVSTFYSDLSHDIACERYKIENELHEIYTDRGHYNYMKQSKRIP